MKINNIDQNREKLAELFTGIGAEIGVEQGVYSEIICKKGKIKKLYSIDAWKAYRGYRDHVRQEKLDSFYEITKNRLKPYKAELVRKFSTDAALDFEDNSLDFVYIDANHNYKHVQEDLETWFKKVKPGGIIAGHDYIRRKGQDHVYAVVPAVHDFVKKNNIDVLNIYRGDHSPSFMFVKDKPIKTDVLDYILNKYSLPYDSHTRMPIEIAQIGRYGLADLFSELGFTTGAEIGVYRGEYSEVLCKANPKLKLYSIDPWDPHPEYTAYIKKETFVDAYDQAKKRLSNYNCEMIKKKSLDAARDFEDESLDFVYIDGDHSFQACTNDIVEWSKKVKTGGIIAGHDYIKHLPRSIIHVYQAVNGYTDALGIRPWFITAAKAVIDGVITAEERTFFWVKNPSPEPRRYDP